MTTARSSRRSARRGQRAESPLFNLPFKQLRNPLPPVELLRAEQLEKIHQVSMRILEDIGIDFLDDESFDLLTKAGLKVDAKTRHVWFDRGFVLEQVAKAPASFTWRARNPERNLLIGENVITFAPCAGMAYVHDLDRGRQTGRMEHYHELLKLVQTCNVLHYAGVLLVEPQDLPASVRHLHRLRAIFTLSDKIAMEAVHGREIPKDIMAMSRLVFGDDLTTGGPVMGGNINASSPLRYDSRMLGGAIEYAREGQVVIVTPFILAGAMSPISIAAAVAQQNAEALAGIAFLQLVNPGAPSIYGGFTTNVDMKSGAPAFGTPEGAWAQLVGAQLARRYHLPYRGNAALSTTQLPDAQGAYETSWNLWPAVMGHTNLAMHSAGWIDGGLTVSYEKFLLDVENLAMFQHFLGGFEISDETFALDMIAEVGPGGHHFGTPHTQARYATEFYQSFTADRQNNENWQRAGAQDAGQRANALWKVVLERYEQPPLDPAVVEALDDYVARRERELADKNLYDTV
jgi:trimethylamine---corrinoid protein Co-methyltransferase